LAPNDRPALQSRQGALKHLKLGLKHISTSYYLCNASCCSAVLLLQLRNGKQSQFTCMLREPDAKGRVPNGDAGNEAQLKHHWAEFLLPLSWHGEKARAL
jgi:hypothetical protein